MNVTGKKIANGTNTPDVKKTVTHSTNKRYCGYVNNQGNVMLRNWVNERKGRAANIARVLYGKKHDTVTGYHNPISNYKHGHRPIYNEDIPKLKAAMYIVESMEPQTKAKYGAMPNAA